MILINKSIQITDLILTLTELTTIANPVYLLVLTNDFNKVKSRFILEVNISKDLKRYDHFKLQKVAVSGLDTGLYSYAVYHSDDTNFNEAVLGKPIETGKAKVIAPGDLVQPIIYQPEQTSGYITYKSIND